MQALQQHQFSEAAESFRAVLRQFPDEKELNDRSRLYLSICERHLRSEPEPRTIEERLYAATLALNAGDPPTAKRHLREILAVDPTHDGALYMLAVAHALGDDAEQALVYLQQAIARNPENRALAFQDGDLEHLMRDESARAAVRGTATHQGEIRTPSPHRPIR